MKKQIETGPNTAVCQKWEESEQGWGTRPDGFSLHLSLDGLAKFLEKYRDRMPKAVPYEYSRPCGTPYEVEVSDKVIAEIEASKNGTQFYDDYDYPGSGGVDGWLPMKRD